MSVSAVGFRGSLVLGAMLIVTACGGGDDTAVQATPAPKSSATSVPSTEPPPPPTTTSTTTSVATTLADDSDESGLPEFPDLARVRNGASIVATSSEYDSGTWSIVNVIDGRADRGWSSTEPTGEFVIGLAHPTVQIIGIDTRAAQEDTYPGVSAVRVEIERVADLSNFPDVDWEPVGVLELEPQTLAMLETPDLFAPLLRFRVANGGDPKRVEIMEVFAWGEFTDVHSADDMIRVADGLDAGNVNVNLGANWAFTARPDGTVAACSSDGHVATLSPQDGSLRGRATTPDGTDVEMIVGSVALNLTAIVDPMGTDPAAGWGFLNASGSLSCDEDNVDEATVLIPDTVPIDQRESDPLLAVVASRGDVAEVRELLADGANPNVGLERNGWTPLLYAAQDGHTEVVVALLDAGARVDQGTDDNWTALMIAAQNGHDNTVAALLSAGANPRVGRSTNWTALHSASLRNHPAIVAQLITAGAPLEAAEDGYTALAIAAQEGNDAVVTLLLDIGARVDGATGIGPTPLYMAAQNDHGSTAQLLIDGGADVDDGGEETPPIVVAASRSNDAMIELLARAGADVDKSRADGMTALHWAANEDSASTAALLLDLGADPGVTNDDGDTPLDLAIRLDADAAAGVLRGGG